MVLIQKNNKFKVIKIHSRQNKITFFFIICLYFFLYMKISAHIKFTDIYSSSNIMTSLVFFRTVFNTTRL